MITATITKIQEKESYSRYKGIYYLVYFKDNSNNKMCYTYIYPKMRNFVRWKNILKEGIVLTGLEIYKGRLINADSRFTVVEKEK